MGDEPSIVVALLGRDDKRSLRELIAKHGTSVLAASYEHTDNVKRWPSFGVSFFLFKMSGVCACCDSDN